LDEGSGGKGGTVRFLYHGELFQAYLRGENVVEKGEWGVMATKVSLPGR